MPQGVVTVFAIIWGVGGVAATYFVCNFSIQQTSTAWQKRLTPILFVGPAILIMGWYLFIPTFRSLYLSFFGKFSKEFVGFANYIYIFTDRTMKISFVNNMLWLIIGTGLCVITGLLIALLADRVKYEKFAK